MPHSLASALFWISVVCCAVAQFFIVRSIRGSQHMAEPAPNLPRSSSVVELLWAVIPGIGLAVLLWFTWRAITA